ncbi:DinB family protein [Parapedobacter deserti]|uniref:DinB family protein n=1 Tax=Parapedobacter deserti TaxID=1912957 RepID=A0ABV7JS54_9SPHI
MISHYALKWRLSFPDHPREEPVMQNVEETTAELSIRPASKQELSGWIRIIAGFPKKIASEVLSLTDGQLDTPYRNGGWTVRQVVHHCADSHMNAFIRFKLALTETDPIIKPYKGRTFILNTVDQFLWMKLLACMHGIATTIWLI